MSTRAFTRLAGDTDVIRIPAKPKPVGRTGKPGNKKPLSDLSTVDAQEPRHQVANPFGGVSLWCMGLIFIPLCQNILMDIWECICDAVKSPNPVE